MYSSVNLVDNSARADRVAPWGGGQRNPHMPTSTRVQKTRADGEDRKNIFLKWPETRQWWSKTNKLAVAVQSTHGGNRTPQAPTCPQGQGIKKGAESPWKNVEEKRKKNE